MNRAPIRTSAAVCLATAGVALAWQVTSGARQESATSPQVFRGGTDAVLVDVYPHRNGRIVEGLTAADFQVFEDGRPQRVESFEFVRLDPLSDAPRTDPNNIPEMRRIAADPHSQLFVVFLDNGHTTIEGGYRIRQPLVNMLERAVGAADLFGVMTPSMRPSDLTLARKTTSIDEQLGKYWTWGTRNRLVPDYSDPMEAQLRACFHERHLPDDSGSEPWKIADGPVIRYLDEILIDRRREERSLSTLEQLVTYLGDLRESRSIILAITDGWLLDRPNQALVAEPMRDRRFKQILNSPINRNTPKDPTSDDGEFAQCVNELNRLAGDDGGLRFRGLIQAANRRNVSFYPVSSAGLSTGDANLTALVERNPNANWNEVGLRDLSRLRDRTANLRTIAEATDGLAVVNTNDLGAGLRRVAEDVSAYYLLTYVSDKPTRDTRFRKIEVKVKGEGLNVRARRGYVARDPAAAKATPAAPTVPAGLSEALSRLAVVRPGASMVARGFVVGANVRIAVELTGSAATMPWPTGTMVNAVIPATPAGQATNVSVPLDGAWRNAWVSFPVPPGPGPWSVTVTVGTGPDRLQEQLIVSRPATTVLGDPIVSRARPAARSPLRPAATLQFSRTERVHVEWPSFSAIDSREARLVDAKGQGLPVQVTLSDSTEPAGIAADVVLSPLAPGDYVIELSTTAGTTSTRHYVAVKVTP
jgi:VWFA-related protein